VELLNRQNVSYDAISQDKFLTYSALRLNMLSFWWCAALANHFDRGTPSKNCNLYQILQ
jgi:hypothetical protein